MKLAKIMPFSQEEASTTSEPGSRITNVRKERLGDISMMDVRKEGHETIEEYIEVWRTLNHKWNPQQEVYVIDFETVKRP
jgi:hypothetical protein